jgi:hypothetical protein
LVVIAAAESALRAAELARGAVVIVLGDRAAGRGRRRLGGALRDG